jgi:hypothetical protein
MLYTFGNITAMSGTMFLMGPKRQCQTMWKPVRAAATAVYLITLVATVIVAFTSQKALPVLILLVIQFCAGGKLVQHESINQSIKTTIHSAAPIDFTHILLSMFGLETLTAAHHTQIRNMYVCLRRPHSVVFRFVHSVCTQGNHVVHAKHLRGVIARSEVLEDTSFVWVLAVYSCACCDLACIPG